MNQTQKEMNEQQFENGFKEVPNHEYGKVTPLMRELHYNKVGEFADDIDVFNWYHGREKEVETLAVASNFVETAVQNPKHYKFFDTEVIEIIRASMTKEQFIGYCKGNCIKYRLRAGKKDDALQDLMKAEEYERYYEEM